MNREKTLEWEFQEDYNGKHVVCFYITYGNVNNVYASFDTLEEAETFMNDEDMWDDYFIYEIIDGYAYAPEF